MVLLRKTHKGAYSDVLSCMSPCMCLASRAASACLLMVNNLFCCLLLCQTVLYLMAEHEVCHGRCDKD